MGRSARGASTSSSSSSSSSSIGHQSNNCNFNRDPHLTTDLHLGLTISASQQHFLNHSIIPNPRDQRQSDHNWPSSSNATVGEGSDIHGDYNCNGNNVGNNGNRLYVKVNMEGHPIGRKLDILAHHGYHDLITTLDHMFNTNILWGAEVDAEKLDDFHVLTYEDEEGDWLMVGDVPWEMFLSAVKRLKISRACPL